jgi:hypothetical protein
VAGLCRVGDKELTGVAELTAEGLYDVMRPFLDPDTEAGSFRVGESPDCFPFATLVGQTLERAGLTAAQLDLVVLHGGSCRSPFILRLFEEMREQGILKDACKVIRTPDLTTSVARGAALYGCLSAKHGEPYIAPIVPEDLSIQTEGGVFKVLVPAGTQLPFTKTFSGKEQFYLTEAGQQEVTIPIYIGYDDRRRRASVLTITFAQTKLPKSHPVEIELTIDTDKISRWRFRPVGHDWCAAEDVANPWVGQEATDELEELQVHRDAIRVTLDAGARPATRVLVEEAHSAARAGFTEEALGLIEDVIHENPADGTAFNIKGLIHGMRGEPRQSADCYDRASALAPENMVYRGNYGVALHKVKRHAEAVEVMPEALSKAPTLTYLHSWLADAFQALGNREQVQKELERWHDHARREVIRRPEDVAAWEELRSTALRLGKYDEDEEAREAIRDLLRLRGLLAGPGHG